MRPVRRSLLAALAVAAASPAVAAAQGGAGIGTTGPGAPGGAPSDPPGLTAAMNRGMGQSGVYSGSEIVDLTTHTTLYAHNADVPRLPASVNKLFTTSTALDRFGPTATLPTVLEATGAGRGATWHGTFYLRGGGDPTFGSYGFDHGHYGTGATVGPLAAAVRALGIRRLDGSIVADASVFDGDLGTPATHGRASIDVEGGLSGLAFDRDWADADGGAFYPSPARHAGDELADALAGAGVRVPGHPRVRLGRTPGSATTLATVHSPTIAALVALTNTPSDNFFAETLAKDIGARFGAGGSTAAGAGVIEAEMADRFHIHPQIRDGSGLSRADRTTPAQVVSLLSQQAGDRPFTDSLAVAGRSGTLAHENRHTYAQGRCTGKTGTLHDVSNVVGYCRAQNGDELAYAFLLNGVDPDAAHPIQDRMQIAVARYDG